MIFSYTSYHFMDEDFLNEHMFYRKDIIYLFKNVLFKC